MSQKVTIQLLGRKRSGYFFLLMDHAIIATTAVAVNALNLQ
ncbi:hypothetical protein [Sporosarcina psychrophila]|nr:hypothetical protein [Sporosarcina psychrophila]